MGDTNRNMLAIIFAIVSLALANTYAPDVPLFAWAGDSSLIEKNQQIRQTLTSNDVSQLIASMLSQTTDFRGYVKGVPEVVVLYLEPQLRSDEVARYSSVLSGLKATIKNSAASLSSPFVTMDQQLSLSDLVSSTKKSGGAVLYFGKGSLDQNLGEVRLVNSVSELKSDPIFSNGIPDLLVVQLSSEKSSTQEKLADTDAVITQVESVISEETKKSISVYTALEYHALSSEIELPAEKRFVVEYEAPSNNGTIPHVFNRWFPNWFWELLVVWVVFLVIAFVGLVALFGLQTPNKLPKAPEPVRRK